MDSPGTLKYRLVGWLDDLLHNRLGWSPRWLCNWNEHVITGERPD
jgi:hypothetical protein